MLDFGLALFQILFAGAVLWQFTSRYSISPTGAVEKIMGPPPWSLVNPLVVPERAAPDAASLDRIAELEAELAQAAEQLQAVVAGQSEVQADERVAELESVVAELRHEVAVRDQQIRDFLDAAESCAREHGATASIAQFMTAAAPDDLKQIRGIGPRLESILNGLGVTQLRQIARWSPEDVAEVDRSLKGFRGRIERDGWVEQARELNAESLLVTAEG